MQRERSIFKDCTRLWRKTYSSLQFRPLTRLQLGRPPREDKENVWEELQWESWLICSTMTSCVFPVLSVRLVLKFTVAQDPVMNNKDKFLWNGGLCFSCAYLGLWWYFGALQPSNKSFHPLTAPPWPWLNLTLTASCMHLSAFPQLCHSQRPRAAEWNKLGLAWWASC